jgi:predicted ribosome quality control (RQC) complex YloA/Tae2 family protein
MGVPVKVNAAGQLGTAPSSARFKEEIQPMDKASEAILALKPVSFRYKKEIDPDRIRQFGLVAEQVEKVNPDLVARDTDGKAYTVRYEAVNAMLLNEFLKEHKRVEAQQATIADLKSTVAQQQKSFQSRLAQQEKQIEALTSGLQKVSAQLEIIKPAQRVVAK